MSKKQKYDISAPKITKTVSTQYNKKTGAYEIKENYRFTQSITPRRGRVRSFVSGHSSGILSAVLFFLLVSVMINALQGKQVNLTFTYFLKIIEGAPVVPTAWIASFANFFRGTQGIGLLGGLSSGIRYLLNILTTPISLILYLVMGIFQILIYVNFIFAAFFGI